MGCAFDTFSPSWVDRSYALTLMVLCWVFPMIANVVCYMVMVYRVRHSNINAISEHCQQMNHDEKKVTISQDNFMGMQ